MILSRSLWLSSRRGASLSTASCCSSSLHFSTGASDTQERTIAARRRKPRLKFSDSFGGLSQDLVMRHEQRREEHKEAQEEQDGEEEYLAKVGDSMRTSRSEFNRRIVRCLKDGDLHGALRVLDVEMKEEERSPLMGHYRPLIHACGKAGYHKKAFQLYREYQARNLPVNYGVYADLFNACANSPFPRDALDDARYLRRQLAQKHQELPQVVYHTMLKALGRCGDLGAALLAVDEMRERRVPIEASTYAHLLHGCISDRASGFRHAVLVWRSLTAQRRHLAPTEAHFHLLLRAARDCGAGDSDFYRDLLLACMSVEEARRHGQKAIEGAPPTPVLEAGREASVSQDKDSPQEAFVHKDSFARLIPNKMVELVPDEEKRELLKNELLPVHGGKLPSVLDDKPDFTGVVAIGSLAQPQQRLALLGGPGGVCAAMRQRGLVPDAKAFTYMLDMVAGTREAEAALLALMDREGVVLDAAFLNMLIKRRALRKDFALGRETLALYSHYQVVPDVITFGVLALCCRGKSQMIQLMRDMDKQGLRPNLPILSTFLNSAFQRRDLLLAAYTLDKIESFGFSLTRTHLRSAERFHERYRRDVLALEREEDEEKRRRNEKRESSSGEVQVSGEADEGNPWKNGVHPAVRRERDEHGYRHWRHFRQRYAEFLSRAEVDTDADAHPWRQFLNEKDVRKAEEDGDEEAKEIIASGDGEIGEERSKKDSY